MREFISQRNSGRQIDLEEIQESSGEGTSNPSPQLEEETPIEPIDESVPLKRSTRVRNAPEHYYRFHITPEGDTLISDKKMIGMDERRNRTLLDMVPSMMSRASLPISFWGYALETATHILNLVPTKKVAKTPHDM